MAGKHATTGPVDAAGLAVFDSMCLDAALLAATFAESLLAGEDMPAGLLMEAFTLLEWFGQLTDDGPPPVERTV